jgi:heme exporter protein A
VIAQLALRGVALRRGGRLLFSQLDLALDAGQAVALTGANGAGKTSLLRAVAGLVRLEAGEIGFGGVDPLEARARGVHLVGHQDALKPQRSVREELGFWSAWCGGAPHRIEAASERLGLEKLLDLEIRRLSAGQRRRVALARLVAAPRALWLLDEPMSPLDAAWRAAFAGLMAEHLADGGLIVAAVHDPLPVVSSVFELAP